MSARVSPSDRIPGEIDALFDGQREPGETIEDVARLRARLITQSALEAEVEVFLGRACYQRAADYPEARTGSRNGYSGEGTICWPASSRFWGWLVSGFLEFLRTWCGLTEINLL